MFLNTDHPSASLRACPERSEGAGLGSTALVTNASGGVVDQQRYYPYGAGRPTDTALPTDYRFTGQRREGTIGLYDYGARFYDPALGRFISADTVVPQPGNPQALNRYSYVLNNPLRYTDPTGFFSEDEIMKHFGVSTWEEVLALFGEGGRFEGLWGWLAMLRMADIDEPLFLFTGKEGLASQRGSLYGYWTIRNGQIGLTDAPGSDTFCSADEAARYAATSAWLGITDEGCYWPLPGQGQTRTGEGWLVLVDPRRQYLWWRLKPENVDWVGVGLDAGGIVLDIFTGGAGGRGTNAVKLARGASTVVGKVDLSRGIWGFLDTKGIFSSPWEAAGLGSDVVGIAPSPIGTIADVVGLAVNFADAGAFQWTP